ncbi:aspartic proteinase CDR1-like [Cornus florida]|uniref:aspartic proteinase CDR1-like n=1 Tax=Cornus florida TaxID=4283 RepID=UPI00289C40D4|nr:aspartic proteinase CDR1-like [Cornus florida]
MFMHFFVIINSFLYSSIIVVCSSNDATTTTTTRTIAITKPRRLVIKLIHRDSIHSPYYNPGATTLDRARWATESSLARFAYLKARIESGLNTTNDVRGVVIPIDTGVELLLNFSIGEPPVPQLAIMDTGSTLTWVQCLPCTKCFNQLHPIFDPSKSSTYVDIPCNSATCNHLKFHSQIQFRCDSFSRCGYRQQYVDNSTTAGNVAFEKLTFMTSDEGTTSFPSILFGCGHSNKILAGELSGVMGLGYDDISLPSRLSSKFSYCIGNIDDPYYNHNRLIIGDGAYIEGYSTPIAVRYGLYHLSVEGISVGEKRLDINVDLFGKDGVVIDSGTTDTLLTRIGFEPLKAEVQSLIGGLLTEEVDSKNPGYLCYRGVVDEDLKGFPVVTFHFAGGADLMLDIDNMFRKTDTNMFCMAMVESGLPNQMSILGIVAQQNYNIGYDLNNMKLYFQRIDCELLVD